MKPSDFIHPEDAAALRQMESIPGFAALVKKILAIGIEKPAVWCQYGIQHTVVRPLKSLSPLRLHIRRRKVLHELRHPVGWLRQVLVELRSEVGVKRSFRASAVVH